MVRCRPTCRLCAAAAPHHRSARGTARPARVANRAPARVAGETRPARSPCRYVTIPTRADEERTVRGDRTAGLHFRFASTAAPARILVEALLFPYDPNHQTFVNIYERQALTQAILDRGRTQLEYIAGTRQGALLVVRRFLLAGTEHMLVGPEHLL